MHNVIVGKESDVQYARVQEFISRVKVDLNGTVYLFGDIFKNQTITNIVPGSLSAPRRFRLVGANR